MNKEKKIDVSNKEPTTMREIRLKRKNIKGIKFMSYLLYSYMNNLYIPTIFLFYSHMNTSILIIHPFLFGKYSLPPVIFYFLFLFIYYFLNVWISFVNVCCVYTCLLLLCLIVFLPNQILICLMPLHLISIRIRWSVLPVSSFHRLIQTFSSLSSFHRSSSKFFFSFFCNKSTGRDNISIRMGFSIRLGFSGKQSQVHTSQVVGSFSTVSFVYPLWKQSEPWETTSVHQLKSEVVGGRWRLR